MPARLAILMLLTLVSVCSPAIAEEPGVLDKEWAQPVKGYQAPKAGEHPRLFFRKSAVAALREKANTPRARRSSRGCAIY